MHPQWAEPQLGTPSSCGGEGSVRAGTWRAQLCKYVRREALGLL